MKSKWVFFVIFLVIVPLIHAQEITFTLDQKEYYFKTGEDAIITLHTENSEPDIMNGMLSYTITQNVNQGNFQYSNTNSQSVSFKVESGSHDVPISFGTSNNPVTLTVSLKFSYTSNESREVSLNDILIHFVQNESQKNNQQEQQSASSQATQQQQNNQQASQNQQLQQLLDQMQNKQQGQQNTQQKLQNNQLSQDSSALKEQMQKDLQDQMKMRDEFKKQLEKNKEFRNAHQELTNQGYNLTNGDINPSSNNTGSFSLEYQKSNGDAASLSGQLNNGEMQNLHKKSSEQKREMLKEVEHNEQFQAYKKQLEKEGFNLTGVEFSQEQNKTTIKHKFVKTKKETGIEMNETAMIQSEIVNNTVQKVELIKEESQKRNNMWWMFLIALLIIIAGLFLYKKFSKKPQENEEENEIGIEKPFDYKAQSVHLLAKAKEQFNKKEHKDAYGTAGQALRLYLSYKNQLNKEITNDEIIDYLKKHNSKVKEIKECFNLCSLVEFAKYKSNKKDFDQIIMIAEKIILN